MKKLRVITFSDKDLGSENKLLQSCKKNDLELIVLTYHKQWASNAIKIKLLFDYLKTVEAEQLLLITDAFDDEHYQLFTFKLSDGHEILMIRAIVKVAQAEIKSSANISSDSSLEDAVIQDSRFYHEAQWHDAKIYDRNKLHSKHLIPGPAIVSEMDSTTVILPEHEAAVDEVGNLIINPTK